MYKVMAAGASSRRLVYEKGACPGLGSPIPIGSQYGVKCKTRQNGSQFTNASGETGAEKERDGNKERACSPRGKGPRPREDRGWITASPLLSARFSVACTPHHVEHDTFPFARVSFRSFYEHPAPACFFPSTPPPPPTLFAFVPR